MILQLKRLLVVCLILTSIPVSLKADEFLFRKNDRIVFLGDSITEQYQYSTDLELYLTTRFPSWNLTFINAGIGGDRAVGGAKRFDDHVLAEQPTVLTINFGMNDAEYRAFDQNLQNDFLRGTEAMLTAAKQKGVRVGLVSPNAVDPRIQERFKGYLETQKQFYAPLKDLAEKFGASFVDQYTTTRAALEKMTADKAEKVVPFHDGFHTGPSGGLLMAHAILTGLKAPDLVSHVGIDFNAFGPNNGGTKSIGCRVENATKTANGLAFDRMDESIPMPIQADWVSLLPYVNQLSDLNRYELLVAGLKPGKYSVNIDGVNVATYTDQELSTGVNLGLVRSGPIYEQGEKVFAAINAKNQIVHARFRGVRMASIPDWLADVGAERRPGELKKRMDLITAKQAEIYQLVQPIKHRFEIKEVN